MLDRIGKFLASRKTPPQAAAEPQGTPMQEAEACKNRGNAHMAKGELDQAIACYQQAIDIAPDYAEAHNNLGFVCLQQGRLEDAESHFRRALSLNPGLANAHYNLGSLLQRLGRAEAAVDRLLEAVRLAPGNADAHEALGNACVSLGRLEDAAAHLRRAVALNPDSFMAHHGLGCVFHSLGRQDDALASFRDAARLRPDDGVVHYNLGVALRRLSMASEATISLQRAVALRPDFIEAHFELGSSLLDQGRVDAAKHHYETVLHLEPEHCLAHNSLGLAFLRQDHLDSALACFREAVRIKPELAAAHKNIGDVLFAQGKLDDALASVGRAIALNPALADAHMTEGVILKGQHRLDEAEASFRQGLELDPDHSAARFILATLQLARGDLSEGWRLYAERFFAGSPTLKRNFPQPQWNGEDLAGKSILLWGDQGIGDELLFASMFPDVIASAAHCVIECAPKLVPLLARSFPRARVVPLSDPPDPATQRGIDFQIAAADAARWLRPTLASFPDRDRYLEPDPIRVEYWRKRLSTLGPGIKVGFCWRSSVRGTFRNLYYTTLEQWGPIFRVPGAHFISLQYDRCDDELAAATQRFGVPLHAFPEVDLFDDLDEAAALTKAMDLIITAPTAAGALGAGAGVPTWELSYGTSWTTLGTNRMPWLPSLRLYTRRWNEDWENVIADVAAQLNTLSAKALKDGNP